MDTPRFSIRWRGYDPAEVDAFLGQTVADRRQLQEDLAQLELLLASRRPARMPLPPSAHRPLPPTVQPPAQRQLPPTVQRSAQPPLPPVSQPSALDLPEPASPPLPNPWSEPSPAEESAGAKPPAIRWSRPAWLEIGTKQVLVGGLSSVGLIALIVFNVSDRPQASPSGAATLTQDIALSSAASTGAPAAASVAESTVPVALPADGLLLTLTARDDCWIRTTVDSERPLERLLKRNDTILLRARDEAVLRVGDAGALSVLINNQPARALGAPGRVVTARITPANYATFLN